MNPIPFPTARGLILDFLPTPLPPSERLFLEMDFESHPAPEAAHDFLIQNSRPDLVRLTPPDHALWALDLP